MGTTGSYAKITITPDRLKIDGEGRQSDRENETRFRVYRKAMREYMRLKAFYVRGKFYGVDELIHVHTLRDRGQAVLNAFNLTEEPREIRPSFDLEEIGLGGAREVRVRGQRGTSYPYIARAIKHNEDIVG